MHDRGYETERSKTPDTVITLTTGKKIIVKESRQEIKNLVKLYRKDIFAE